MKKKFPRSTLHPLLSITLLVRSGTCSTLYSPHTRGVELPLDWSVPPLGEGWELPFLPTMAIWGKRTEHSQGAVRKGHIHGPSNLQNCLLKGFETDTKDKYEGFHINYPISPCLITYLWRNVGICRADLRAFGSCRSLCLHGGVYVCVWGKASHYLDQ